MHPDEPTVSVIVPIYKVERYLDQCVRSVLGQTFQGLELILVDDGSPDGCGAMIDGYAAEDARVVVIHQENQGLSGARNAGLARARGDYVGFLDSDDYWEGADSLERCVAALRERPDTDVLFFDALRFYESTGEKIFGDEVWEAQRVGGASNAEALHYMLEISDVRPSAWSKLIRRQFLLDNELQFRLGIFSEDVEWFLRLVTHPAKYDYLPLPFYMYRKNRAGSITNTIGRANVEHLFATVLRSSQEMLNSDATPAFKTDYLSYCFYQFTIALGFYGGLSRSDRAALRHTLTEAKFLVGYHHYGRSKAVARMARLLGLQVTAWVLHTFLQLRAVRRSWRQ